MVAPWGCACLLDFEAGGKSQLGGSGFPKWYSRSRYSQRTQDQFGSFDMSGIASSSRFIGAPFSRSKLDQVL
jgi:hypothetical protein